MASDDQAEDAARAKLHLPKELEIPEIEALEDDIRATLLHTVSLRKALSDTGIVCSPIWEGFAGEAAVRAAVVPPEVVTRHNEGAGVRALADATVVTMLADVVAILLEDPVSAVKVLGPTETLWISPEAPVRSLETPYKAHFKLLTLVVADFIRKIGAGFTELEWIASLGLLEAFHDPAGDPTKPSVLATTHDKTAAMCAAEEEWMRALQAEA